MVLSLVGGVDRGQGSARLGVVEATRGGGAVFNRSTIS